MNLLWKQAIRQAVSSACAVIITNMVDSATPMFSWPWFRHMLIGMFFLTLLNEARYWKQWADGPDDPPPTQGGAMKGIGSRTVGMLAVVALLAMGCIGCNKTQDVLTAIGVTQNVILLAQDDLPSLQAAGILTASDATNFGNWLSGATLILSQGKTCVSGAGGTTSKIAGCVTAIGTGLTSPAELADLRIISPGAQKKVTLYVTAVILAADFTAQIVNAIQATTPPVGTAPSADAQPSREDLHELADRIHLSPEYGF